MASASVMAVLLFVVNCGIVRSLCAMRVFKVPASSSSLGFVQNFVFVATSVAELARGEKSCTQSINHSISHSLIQLI